jgi:hypothetical protein
LEWQRLRRVIIQKLITHQKPTGFKSYLSEVYDGLENRSCALLPHDYTIFYQQSIKVL